MRRMRTPPATTILVVLSTWLLFGAQASAGVPPHAPGSVCYTPFGFCSAQPAGAPGTPCACPGPRGPVGGVRG